MEMQLSPKFQCTFKEQELYKRYASDPSADRKVSHLMIAHSERNGCNRFSEKPIHYLDNFAFHSCLCNFCHPLINYYLIITDNYDNGVMPHAGSISDQSSKLIDIIYLIKSIRQEHQQKLQAENQSKGK